MNIDIKFSVTDSALSEFRKALVSEDSLVRISVVVGGCSGDGYGLGIEEASEVDPSADIVEEIGGLKFVADKASALRLDGIVVDWVSEDGHEGFKFTNSKPSSCCRKGGCST